MAYVPQLFQGAPTAENIARYLEGELLAISREFSEQIAVDLRPVHVAPLRPREGMLVCADGTDWNPGAGKGIYAFLGGAWSKL